MSLKAFHIVFVILTTILSLFVALWGIREFAQQKSISGLALGLVFLVAAIALMVYGRKVWAKFKEIP
jgi:amino acid transporter